MRVDSPSFLTSAGFNTSSNRAGYAYAILIVLELWAVTLGQAVAALTPTILAATYCNPFIVSVLSLLCGVTVRRVNFGTFLTRADCLRQHERVLSILAVLA